MEREATAAAYKFEDQIKKGYNFDNNQTFAEYAQYVLELKERYGNVKFLLITTVLMHDPRWDEVLDEIKEELGDYVYRYRFNRNGAATPGHPRATEQTEMAVELEQFIRANML